ncbi:hypothetical protein D3C71_2235300 [compost metagenome]
MGQFVLGTDTGGEDDKVDFQCGAVGELHGLARLLPAVDDFLGIFAGMNFDAHAFDFTT